MRNNIRSYRGTDFVQAAGRKHGAPDNAGFSLIEVMIGIAIFSIGVLAIFGMQLSGIKGNSTARHYTETSTGGVDKIEALIALPYTHPDLTDTDGDGGAGGDLGLFDATVGAADHFENDPAGQYTIFWNVADNDLIEHSKTVSVIILFNGTGMQRSVSMQRVIPEII
jgi:prepilin-type N-terminal cleavage/methylation domain-containing protein